MQLDIDRSDSTLDEIVTDAAETYGQPALARLVGKGQVLPPYMWAWGRKEER